MDKIKIKNKQGFWSRRSLLKKGGLIGSLAAVFGGGSAVVAQGALENGDILSDTLGSFFQKHYRRMSENEMRDALARIEREAERRHGVKIQVGNEAPQPGVVFGQAINLSRCKGFRKCVEGCVKENNQSRDPQIQFIRVLEMDIGENDLNYSDHYYDGEKVPREGKYYLPISCMQCDNPPCIKNCPVKATWVEPDGIVVIDYNWCIGCRYCQVACAYWARHFNWNEPVIPQDEVNPDTHFLGNRPRYRGVVEKCTFCVQRTRKNRLPACVEACPTGARIFGNLLDPASEIRYILENKRVFRLKEDLGTQPKFWYYSD